MLRVASCAERERRWLLRSRPPDHELDQSSPVVPVELSGAQSWMNVV